MLLSSRHRGGEAASPGSDLLWSPTWHPLGTMQTTQYWAGLSEARLYQSAGKKGGGGGGTTSQWPEPAFKYSCLWLDNTENESSHLGQSLYLQVATQVGILHGDMLRKETQQTTACYYTSVPGRSAKRQDYGMLYYDRGITTCFLYPLTQNNHTHACLYESCYVVQQKHIKPQQGAVYL